MLIAMLAASSTWQVLQKMAILYVAMNKPSAH
jgi:hypothetical protein